VRHLSVGEPCPIDTAPVSRTHCSACPSFISFRSTEGVDTVGCSWGEDMVAWLRREMSVGRPRQRAGGAPRRAGSGGRSVRPRAPKRRPGFAGGTSFGLFLAALGVGIALSALEAPE
jgi:hypothetical protein